MVIYRKIFNFFFKFDDLSRLRGCIRLQDVTLRGNPISRIAKYRDQVRAHRTAQHWTTGCPSPSAREYLEIVTVR